MNYTELVNAIQEYCIVDETEFNNNINNFIEAAENKIYMSLKGPVFWKSDSSATTISGTDTYTVVQGVIDITEVKVKPSASVTDTLLRKDRSFLDEAYPDSTADGVPKYYSVEAAAVFGTDVTTSIRMAPVPDASYAYTIEFYGKSATDTITDGGTPSAPTTKTTWLSIAFPEILLHGAVYFGYIFQKGRPDVLQNYKNEFEQGIVFLKNLSEGRQDNDEFKKDAQEAQI